MQIGLAHGFIGERDHRGGTVDGGDADRAALAGQAQHDVAGAAADVENGVKVLRRAVEEEIDEGLVGGREIRRRIGARLFAVFHDLGFEYALHEVSSGL